MKMQTFIDAGIAMLIIEYSQSGCPYCIEKAEVEKRAKLSLHSHMVQVHDGVAISTPKPSDQQYTRNIEKLLTTHLSHKSQGIVYRVATMKLIQEGRFPMHAAAGAGAIESIGVLLSVGYSPRAKDEDHYSPLHHAAECGQAECVSFLCKIARSTITARSKDAGDTPLHCAVRSRYVT